MLRGIIIIPCYNEEGNIIAVFDRLRQVSVPQCILEIIFINDASTDNSKKILEHSEIPHLDNCVNLGIGGAVQLGFMYAELHRFDFAIQLDGDGQHRPEDVPKILQPLIENSADITVGSRFKDAAGYKSSKIRRVGIRFFSWLNKVIAGIEILDSTSGFRAFNKRAIRELVEYYPDEYPEPEVITYLASKSLRILEIPVHMEARQTGKSSIRPMHTFYYMWKVFLNIILLRIRLKNE